MEFPCTECSWTVSNKKGIAKVVSKSWATYMNTFRFISFQEYLLHYNNIEQIGELTQ